MPKPLPRRLMRAQLRDTFVLLKQFRLSLLLFLALPGFAQGFQSHGTDNAAHAAGLGAGLLLGALLPLEQRLGDPPSPRTLGAVGIAAIQFARAPANFVGDRARPT